MEVNKYVNGGCCAFELFPHKQVLLCIAMFAYCRHCSTKTGDWVKRWSCGCCSGGRMYKGLFVKKLRELNCVTSKTTFSDGVVIFRHAKLIPCLNKTHLELVRGISSLTE